MTTGAVPTFSMTAASTGMVHDNKFIMNSADVATSLDVGACWCMENYFIADDDTGGAKAGAVDYTAASCAVTADG